MSVCSQLMSTGQICKREVYMSSGIPQALCIMHSADPGKDTTAFDVELRRMLKDKDFDFTAFVFTNPFRLKPAELDMTFQDAVFSARVTVDAPWYPSRLWRERVGFGGIVSFAGSKFADASFDSAEFTRSVTFQSAQFSGDVSFSDVVFGGGVTFTQARFEAAVGFVRTSFGPKAVADSDRIDSKKTATFVETVFKGPDQVLFRDVNINAEQGLRLRARACDVEKFRFENVRWHKEEGRIVLQDELDLRAALRLRPPGKSLRLYRRNLFIRARYGSFEEYPKDAHESVAITYNQLIKNFDSTLDSDAAEDAFRGAMEMKRLAPENRPFNRHLRRIYDRFHWIGAVSSCVSIVAAYKFVSEYGGSYRRGFLILALLLMAFAMVYAQVGGLEMSQTVRSVKATSLPTLAMALLEAIEVASFQRDATIIITTTAGRAVRLIESVVVPGQVAIVLLALRRRFKR